MVAFSFIETEHISVFDVLGILDSFADDSVSCEREELRKFALAFNLDGSIVEFIRRLDNGFCVECSDVREKGILHCLNAGVGERVGTGASFVKCESHIGAFRGHAVLAVVEYSYAVVCLGHIGPLVVADFKLSFFDGVVSCCGSVDVTELDLVLNECGADAYVKACFKDGVSFVPVELCFKINSAVSGVECGVDNSGGAAAGLECASSAVLNFAVGYGFAGNKLCYGVHLHEYVVVDVPVVP